MLRRSPGMVVGLLLASQVASAQIPVHGLRRRRGMTSTQAPWRLWWRTISLADRLPRSARREPSRDPFPDGRQS